MKDLDRCGRVEVEEGEAAHGTNEQGEGNWRSRKMGQSGSRGKGRIHLWVR
jgi:hypothetical protein